MKLNCISKGISGFFSILVCLANIVLFLFALIGIATGDSNAENYGILIGLLIELVLVLQIRHIRVQRAQSAEASQPRKEHDL